MTYRLLAILMISQVVATNLLSAVENLGEVIQRAAKACAKE